MTTNFANQFRCSQCKTELSYKGYCEDCRAKMRGYNKARKEKYQAAGLCTRCGNQPEPGKKICEKCIQGKVQEQNKRVERGLCRFCTNAPARRGLCQKHLDDASQRGKAKNLQLRKDVLDAYGGPQCRCCPESTFEFMTIDHINNDGAEHRRELGDRGLGLYLWLKKNNFPPGFQVLCFNCNIAKGIHGICPHQRTKND